jgi:hypothetical protein
MNKSKPETRKNRILEKPDKFRPPSHPQRIVSPARTPSGQPVNYGPRLTAKEREEQNKKQYPSMFPPEGTVMFNFLTSRWIHVWIAMVSGFTFLSNQAQPAAQIPMDIHDMEDRILVAVTNICFQGILTTLATFTFTTNFKASSPFAHLLPPWSGLFTSPFETISQALSVYRMHVQHESMRVREKRHARIEDAEKRRQYRVAHGLEEPAEEKEAGDDQSPIAVDEQSPVAVANQGEEYVDFDGKRKPVKKWLGIW